MTIQYEKIMKHVYEFINRTFFEELLGHLNFNFFLENWLNVTTTKGRHFLNPGNWYPELIKQQLKTKHTVYMHLYTGFFSDSKI